MLKTRYHFLKRLYPECVLIFSKKHYHFLYGEDQEIVRMIKKEHTRLYESLERHHINYLVVTNMEIVRERTYQENHYQEYRRKALLFQRIKALRMRREQLLYQNTMAKES